MISINNKELFLNIWKKQATELSLLEKENIIFREQDIFETFLQYKENPQEFQKYNKDADFITAVNGELTPTPMANLLASDDDESMNGYISRLDKYNQGKEWCIAYFGLHTINEKIWDTARDFAQIVYRNTDKKPTGRVDVDCFLGNYTSTHTGIHVDYAHNFAFTLRNGKKMYTWSPNFTEVKGLRYPNYDNYKKNSKILSNEIDRICYFPYDYFHVAESQNVTSLVVNIAFWEENEDVNTILTQISNGLYSDISSLDYIKYTNISDNDFKSGQIDLNDSYKDINKFIIDKLSPFNINLKILAYQLIKMTSSNLFVPRPINRDYTLPEYLIKSPNAILQWARLDNIILISANGHCSYITYENNIESFLSDIVNNNTVKVQAYKNFYNIITKLYSWGCLLCKNS